MFKKICFGALLCSTVVVFGTISWRQPLECVAADNKEVDQLKKKLKDAEADAKKAESKVNQLEKEIKEQNQQIQKLQNELKKEKGDDKNDAKMVQEIKQLQQHLREKDAQVQKLQVELAKHKGSGSDSNDHKELEKAKKDLAVAQQALKDKEELIATLKKDGPKGNADLTKEVENLRKVVKELEALKKAPYVHSVVFRAKKDIGDKEVKAMLDDVPRMLGKITCVRGIWVGKPSAKGTPDVSLKDYQIGLVVVFDDEDGLQKYLNDPLHKLFVDKHTKNFEKPTVYDFLRD